MYQDAKDFERRCPDARSMVTLVQEMHAPHHNHQVEIFDVWGIDYMGHFPMSRNCEYILVAVDYVSKWVEAIPCHATVARARRKCSTT
jgi:hypothetical protein